MSKLNDYISSLLRHGWEESWLPELTIEQVAAISSLANAELHEMVKRLGDGE